MTDHRFWAEELLRRPEADEALAKAQVHALLAVADEMRLAREQRAAMMDVGASRAEEALRRALLDALGDDSYLDKAARALIDIGQIVSSVDWQRRR